MKTDEEENFSKMPLVIPDQHYLAERYLVRIPVGDSHFKSKWELRKYAVELLEKKLGDDVQLASMKVKQPHLAAKTKARLLKREPCARAFVTVKF